MDPKSDQIAVDAPDWRVYRPHQDPGRSIADVPSPPPWRVFDGGPPLDLPAHLRTEPAGLTVRARVYEADEHTVDLVNGAIYLRRPLLVTGKPGTGKSTLARSIAYELDLGPVLTWPVTSRSTLHEGLYQYDAVSRLESGAIGPAGSGRRPSSGSTGAGGQEAGGDADTSVGRYITLGPLGTAVLPWRQPRVLLIDELDKSDIDLPNDLLHVFEEGSFDLPELIRLPEEAELAEVLTAEGQRVPIRRGHVRCLTFPITVITSNGEREFPPAFLRRCVRVDIKPPREEALKRIVDGLLGAGIADGQAALIEDFLERRELADVATDQLLNAIYIVTSGEGLPPSTQDYLKTELLRELESGRP